MDCFQDFCLYCDRDSPDGAYCSQQCKLADLERSSNSQPSSPTNARQSWNSSSSSHRHDSYHYRQSSTPGYDAPTGHSSRPRGSYFMYHPSQQQQASDRTAMDERSLTPSSSRTSLSSTTSSSGASAGGISNTQAKQLAEYFSSFDAAKAAKRRSSLR